MLWTAGCKSDTNSYYFYWIWRWILQICSRGTPVFINGGFAKLVGRVSMDSIMIDITHVKSKVSVGDEAILWGKDLPLSSGKSNGLFCLCHDRYFKYSKAVYYVNN